MYSLFLALTLSGSWMHLQLEKIISLLLSSRQQDILKTNLYNEKVENIKHSFPEKMENERESKRERKLPTQL